MGPINTIEGRLLLGRGTGKEEKPAAVAAPALSRFPARQKQPLKLAYIGIILFMGVYCLRPQDWIPFIGIIPIAKICGLLAIGGFFAAWVTGKSGPLRFPREMLYLTLLFCQFVLCIPFAIWRGGSFQVVIMNFSEVVILTIVLALSLNSMDRLRRIVFIQSLGIALVSVMSLLSGKTMESMNSASRIVGAIGGVFENPNDLAVAVAMALPFCFMFLFRAKGALRKTLWVVTLFVMARAVLATYSRSGLLALSAALIFILYEYGIKGRRPQLFFYALFAMGLVLVLGSPKSYSERVESITDPDSDPTGSAQQRREILIQSLKVTAANPVFGVGPGNFPIVSGVWRVSHNTYTELSAEAGIPALILFLLIFGRSLKNIRRSRQYAPEDQDVQALAGGLRASIAAFLVGSFFASTSYHFFPYFLVAYASALLVIAQSKQAENSQGESTPRRTLPWQAKLGSLSQAGKPVTRGAF